MTAVTSTASAGPVLLTVPEACAQLRISRWLFYRLLNAGELRTVRAGRRRLVPADAVVAFVAEHTDQFRGAS